MVTFQDDKSLKTLCKGTGFGELLVAVGTVAFQSLQFLGVGGKDSALWYLLQPSPMVGQNVDSISIDDDRTQTAPDLCYYGDGRLFGGT